jgi:hypothetical protein
MLAAALPLLAALAPETDSIVLIDENVQEIEYPAQNWHRSGAQGPARGYRSALRHES